jgi:hypothetical protein
MPEDSFVCIERPRSWRRGSLRRYWVLIDGSKVGRLRNGASITFRVRPGPHKIEARIDWSGSEKLRFTIDAGKTANFICEPSSALGIVAAYSRSNYLVVRLADDSH